MNKPDGRCAVRPILCAVMLFVASSIAPPLQAQPVTYRVGGDACDFTDIQAAINAAANHPGPDIIRVAMNRSYDGVALKLGAQELSIVGGFATCASTSATAGARTVISGLGGPADSVLEIIGAGNRSLINLVIRDGDETSSRAGGGIDFAGEGFVALTNVTVSLNRAGYGGGINFNGTGSGGVPTALILGTEVLVQGNTAANSGGGVRMEGRSTLFMTSPRSTITDNEAQGFAADSGFGGGIQVLPPAAAEIGSPGYVNFGAVSGNRAKYGGGIALSAREEGDDDAYALLYSTDAGRPVRIDRNIASIAGGGVYLNANYDLTAYEPTFLCAYDFLIDRNQAPDGAAIFLDHDSVIGSSGGALADFNVATSRCAVGALPPRPSARACAAGVRCNVIEANVVAQANGTPADGAVLRLSDETDVRLNRVTFTGNRGSDVVRASDDSTLELANCAFVDNVLTARVIASSARVQMSGCTIAGNQVGLSDVLSLTGSSNFLSGSIVWQPGRSALAGNHGALSGALVLTNDPASVPLPNVINLDPRFIDPGRGDYRLRAASPGLDAGAAEFEFNQALDLDGLERHIGLPQPDGFGPRDLGAYERQDLAPLVINAQVSTDLAHWQVITAGVSTFDANENAPDSPAGGAMRFDWSNSPVVAGRIVSRAQCIHLPLPGTYVLNGYARTTGSNAVAGQIALLHWDIRRDGTEACTTGAIDAQGDLFLASGTAWAQAQTAAVITVTPEDFTRNSSITISTAMIGTGITAPPGMHGWFDDIRLTLQVDDVFSDGFESP